MKVSNLNSIYKIDGWLTFKEIDFLFEKAKQVENPNVIVEIGSWKGKSTVTLALGSKEGNNSHVFAIDTFTGSKEHNKDSIKINTFKEFQSNLNQFKVNSLVKPIIKTSEDASEDFDQKIGLLFIDGSHDFKNVWQDLKLWTPKVINDGIIALHDSWHFMGVHNASLTYILLNSNLKNIGIIDTITYWQKTHRNNLIDKIKIIFFLLKRPLLGYKGFQKLKKNTVI